MATAAPSDFTPVPANLADSSATGYVVSADGNTIGSHLTVYTVGKDGLGANAVLSTTTVTVQPSPSQHRYPSRGRAR